MQNEREQIARIILFESGMFSTDAEIKANSDHRLVKVALRAADKILALRQPPAPQWRPIAEAPRDGTRVLLWSEMWETTWGVQQAFFDKNNEEWETAEGCVSEPYLVCPEDEDGSEDYDADALDLGPTHFMPLPTPPEPDQ